MFLATLAAKLRKQEDEEMQKKIQISDKQKQNDQLRITILMKYSNLYLPQSKIIKNAIDEKYGQIIEELQMIHNDNKLDILEISISTNKEQYEMIYSRMLQDPIIKKNNMNIITDKIEKFILELKNV